MFGNILSKSRTIEMQVICTKCFEHADPSFETKIESNKNISQRYPDSLMKLFYLSGTREGALKILFAHTSLTFKHREIFTLKSPHFKPTIINILRILRFVYRASYNDSW
jgi:hypothetical protein